MPLASSEGLPARLDAILPRVTRPARYTGNEWNSIVKSWSGRLHVALAYPDVYEEAANDPLMQAVYALLNRDDDIACERVFIPWPDMDDALRQAGVPLYTLESKCPLADFDLVLVVLSTEITYPCVLTLLDLAQIPLHAADRQQPMIVGIGPCTANPEPLADFFDAFIIGDVDSDIVRAVVRGDAAPSAGLYRPHESDGVVVRRSVPLPPPVTRPIVPYVETRREWGHVEMAQPPLYPWTGEAWRQRPAEDVLAAVEAVLAATGYDEIHLVGPHDALADIVERLATRYGGAHLHMSLDMTPLSPRRVDLTDRLPRLSRGALTFDLEGSAEDILEGVRLAFRRGWHVLRVNATVGRPGETWDDIERIVTLARQARDIGREETDGQAQVHVILSPYVSRAHGPHERAPLLLGPEWDKRLELLSRTLRGPGLRHQWRGLETRLTEAALARGDRSLGRVIEAAWRAGAHRPEEARRPDVWQAAWTAVGMDPASYGARQRTPGEILPWSQIVVGPSTAMG